MRLRKVRPGVIVVVALALAAVGVTTGFLVAPGTPPQADVQVSSVHVPGENYQICSEPSKYLTSPWTYDVLKSGTQNYTVAQYEALPGYGTKLPPLPKYIAGEAPTAEAAVIFAPGENTAKNQAAYKYPNSPILYFFEGGSYGAIGLESVSGDQFIGGSSPGFGEPTFNDGGNSYGIDATNDTYDYSGGASTLSASAAPGAQSVTTASALPGYIAYITFADGATYGISQHSGTSVTLDSPLRKAEASGSPVWANSIQPIATVGAAAAPGATSIAFTQSSIPLVPHGEVVLGDDTYELTSVAGQQSDYTAGIARLDKAVSAGTPIYYNGLAGGVTVAYLDISHDLHTTSGTISTGSGWTIEHNNIHDSYGKPGEGVAFYGAEESTVEYNCFSKMGDYAGGGSGTGTIFDYNEVLETAYEPDPGCGCSGGGKWWGTLNADIVDNAFVQDGVGGGQPAVWLDNGNAGTLIEGNYFYRDAGTAIVNETGYNMRVANNLFLDDGWGTGHGQASNNAGAVDINSSGGFNIPGSRFENSVSVTSNYFVNDWQGVDVWQSGQRSCDSSGEGWPVDASYCSGGFPTTDTTGANGQYYFSHIGDTSHGGAITLAQPASVGTSTLSVQGAEAIGDQVGFANPVSTTTSDRVSVSSLTGSGAVNVASTAGFPATGQLRVGTSAAWSDGGGSFTGAVLRYTGTTASSFTGVSLVRGSGTLSGPVLEVQPYKVTAETCFANECALTVSPPIASAENAGNEVSNAGTCQLYATSAARPSGPLAPDGVSYWDGCQWQARDIAVTGNEFVFQPDHIAAGRPPEGTATSTVCTAGHADACGTNFMAFQATGEAPFNDQTGGNALMSSASFSGCPSWDGGCAADPLRNLNSLSNPAGSTANNGGRPGDNVWSDNTYVGSWGWYAYLYGNCSTLPSDRATGQTMPSDACGPLNFAAWQSDWQQDASSTEVSGSS